MLTQNGNGYMLQKISAYKLTAQPKYLETGNDIYHLESLEHLNVPAAALGDQMAQPHEDTPES